MKYTMTKPKPRTMKTKFAIICDNAFFGEDGKLSIIQTFDGISAKSFPTIWHRLVVAGIIEFEATQINTKTISQSTEIIHSNSNKVVAKTKPIDMDLGLYQKNTVKFFSTFEDLIFKEPGEYYVNFVIDGKTIPKVDYLNLYQMITR